MCIISRSHTYPLVATLLQKFSMSCSNFQNKSVHSHHSHHKIKNPFLKLITSACKNVISICHICQPTSHGTLFCAHAKKWHLSFSKEETSLITTFFSLQCPYKNTSRYGHAKNTHKSIVVKKISSGAFYNYYHTTVLIIIIPLE